MNEAAQNLLVSLVKKATDGIDAAVSFSQAQIPDVISQMLVWKMTVSVLWTVGAAIIAVFTVMLCKAFIEAAKGFKSGAGELAELRLKMGKGVITWTEFNATSETMLTDKETSVREVMAYTFCVVTAVIGLGLFLAFLDFDWLKILIAPKFYLVEYATTLVK